jgi:hypothetical protein
MGESFPLAPMSRLVRGLTIGLLLVPAIIYGTALVRDLAGDESTAEGLRWLAYALALADLAVWLGIRPSRFEIGDDALVIVWPVRQRRVPLAEIGAVKAFSQPAFRGEFGRVLRIGVGGLYGVFGWLHGRKHGWMDVYVSRLDGCVVLDRPAARPLLISPVTPERFVAAMQGARAAL